MPPRRVVAYSDGDRTAHYLLVPVGIGEDDDQHCTDSRDDAHDAERSSVAEAGITRSIDDEACHIGPMSPPTAMSARKTRRVPAVCTGGQISEIAAFARGRTAAPMPYPMEMTMTAARGARRIGTMNRTAPPMKAQSAGDAALLRPMP